MMRKQLLFGSLAVACGVAFTVNLRPGADNGAYVPRNPEAEVASEGIAGAIEYLNSMRANPETGLVDPADVIRARKAVDAMPSTKALGLNWEELGPDNVGGRTRAILIDKNNPARIFAGGVSGGLWVSNNGGQSWSRVQDGIDMNIAVVSLAQAANGDIYVGTGEGMYYSASGLESQGILGQGVYKSTDGGNTFTYLTSTTPSSPNSSGASWTSVGRLACDPVNPDRIYASTNRGFWISDDGGQSWTEEGLTGSSSSRDVEVASDGRVYLQYSTRVYVSPNGNPGTFTQLADIPSSSGRIELAVAPSDPNTLYVVTTNGNEHTGIYVTNDGGATFEQISAGASTQFSPLAPQAGYNLALGVFPNNKDKFLIGGIQLWQYERGVGFQRIASEFRAPGNTLYVHADKHTFAFHPTNPNIYYIGSDGGIGYTSNGGQTFTERNKGYNVTQFYTLAMTADGRPMGGTQDNSCPFVDGSGNTARAARIVGGGDGAAVGISQVNDQHVFYSSQYGGCNRSSNAGSSGSSIWPQSMVNEDLDHPDFHSTTPGQSGFASFIAAMDLWHDPVDSNNYTVMASVGNGIWFSKNIWDFSKDTEWWRMTTNGGAHAIKISDDGDVAYITYFGSLVRVKGLLGASDSLTGHWKSDQSVLDIQTVWSGASRLVTDVAINPDNTDEVVFTLGQYGSTSSSVYYSNNANDATPTWTAVQGNLPNMPVYSATFVRGNAGTALSGVVLLGTEFGLFATEDIDAGSVVWEEENEGLDRVPIFQLKQQRYNAALDSNGVPTSWFTGNSGEVFAATHGRGFFKTRNFVSTMEQNLADKGETGIKIFPNPVVNTANLALELNATAEVSVEVYALDGKLVKQVQLGSVMKGSTQVELDVTDLSPGIYLTKVVAGKQLLKGKMLVANR